jgi:tRNA threonylcarbamoyladenosine biosynthesis protein TsaE
MADSGSNNSGRTDADSVAPVIRELANPEATLEAGSTLAQDLLAAGVDRLIVYLDGELGAGKTTFARGFLTALGHDGPVPSPTYTLIEPYELGALTIYHIDLYRLGESREVEDLGLAELPGRGVILLVEWPQRAGGRVAAADLKVALGVSGTGRRLEIRPSSPGGRLLLDRKKSVKHL